ncbi:MAG: pyruvate kinase [Elusimicrobiota bacterium]
MVKTKIICTVGPASGKKNVLKKMMEAGMDIARLNFSHGTHPEHLERIRVIRELNRKYRRRIKILQDLEGFRIRVGDLPEAGLRVAKNQAVILTNGHGPVKGRPGVIPVDYDGSMLKIKPGSRIYIDDGTIALTALSAGKESVKVRVMVPGTVKKHKGINIPGVNLEFRGITDKDWKDIGFGIEQNVDYIAQSFVRDREDVEPIRKYLAKKLPACKLIAKIENREGIENIGRILGVVDGIMIARGDMGISIPIYEVPVVQKELIHKCNLAGKFVITATQMLESMTDNAIPTRAEVTDVANAVFDGTDMVMLSGETAVGRYPVKTVDMMNSILKYTETYLSRK